MDFKLSETSREMNALYMMITLKDIQGVKKLRRYSVRSCKSSIKTNAGSTAIIELKGEHSHESDKKENRPAAAKDSR